MSVHPRWSLLCLSLVVLSGCPGADDSMDTGADGATGDTDDAGDTDTPGDSSGGEPPLSGEELFLQLCAPCHGQSGEGTALGYELQHPVRLYSTWVVRNGRPGTEFETSSMAAYSTDVVSDQQLEEIWDYLDSFPQPTTGEGLYLDYCRNCHGVDANGGVVLVNLHEAEAQLELFEKVREGEDAANPGVRLQYMPAFGTAVLSDAEVQLIKDHIDTL